MPTIFGTEGNDDGVAAARLVSSSTPSVLFGLAGNDVLVSASRPFDPTPDVMHGGTGDDLYILPALGVYFIYSTPIIQVPFAGDVVIHEEIRAEDSQDRIDLTQAGFDIQTSAVFDGTDLVIQSFARSSRLVGNYGVDARGNLLAGVDFATMEIYGPAPPGSGLDAIVSLQTFDLKLRSAEFDFLRNGTTAGDLLQGDGLANVIEGGAGKDTQHGGDGNDFVTGGVGADRLFGDAGDDRLFGGDGADLLDGGDGDDRLEGMRGNDRLNGGLGNDTYGHGGKGEGLDTIIDAGGAADAIAFGAGVRFDDLTFTLVGDGLTITVATAGGKLAGVHIVGQAAGGRIETLRFADGSTYDLGAGYNRAPVAAADLLAAVAGRANAFELFADNGSGVDRDPDGDPFWANAGTFATAAGGVVTVAADGAAEYRAADGFTGEDSFTYTILDAYGAAATATVTLSVGANHPPIALDDLFSGREDVAITGNVLVDNGQGADGDADGDAIAVVAGSFTTAAGGHVQLAADGRFTFTPASNQNGTDSFAYTVVDGFGGTTTGSVRIDLEAVNDAPRAGADGFIVNAAEPFTGNLLVNDTDADGDTLAARPATFVTSIGGQLTVAADGSFTYKNFGGYLTQDVFSYVVEDGNGGTKSGQVVVSLRAPPGALAGGAADDVLRGGVGSDTLFGQWGKDDLLGGGGGDLLFGGSDDDDLDGGDGNDALYGGLGVDKLIGGRGNDTLQGGPGADQLRGDEGADTFLFVTIGEGLDRIADFARAEGDRLDLGAVLGAAFDAAVDEVTDFVRITQVGTASVLEVDADGAAGPLGFAILATLLATSGLTDERALYDTGIIIL